MFPAWTTQQTDSTMVIHQFFGPRRLGPIGGIEQDTPSLDTPMAGTGSAVWHGLAQSKKGTLIHTDDTGWNSGWLRTAWNIQPSDDGGSYACGMFCCASQGTLIAGAGECYVVGLRFDDEVFDVVLGKNTAGISLNPGAVLAVSAGEQWEPLTNFTTELRWVQTPGHVLLSYAQGSQASYSDLVTILTYDDTTAPLTATVGQGFWGLTGSALQATFFMDTTRGKEL